MKHLEYAIPIREKTAQDSLTWGTEWLNEEDAALVVTCRAARAKDAGALVRRGTALGTRRALENMARVEGASVQLGRMRMAKEIGKCTKLPKFRVVGL